LSVSVLAVSGAAFSASTRFLLGLGGLLLRNLFCLFGSDASLLAAFGIRIRLGLLRLLGALGGEAWRAPVRPAAPFRSQPRGLPRRRSSRTAVLQAGIESVRILREETRSARSVAICSANS